MARGKCGKTLHLHLWLKFFAIFVDVVAVDFLCLWTVQNFLATFYKCVACQLNRSLSLPLPYPTFPLSLCVAWLFWHLPQWPRSGLTLLPQRAAESFSLCTVPCDEPFGGWCGKHWKRGGPECGMPWLKPFCQHPATLLCHVQYFSHVCCVFCFKNSAQLDFSNPGCPTR